MNSQLPAAAQFVIIGGGAIGCGAAFAMARAGLSDILLLERAEDVGQTTTAQGAGLCGQVRDSVERIKLAMRSVATFRQLQMEEPGTNSKLQGPSFRETPNCKEDSRLGMGASLPRPDWHEVGSLRIALSESRAEEFRRLKKTADEAGLETALIDVSEAKRRWPLMNFLKVKAVLWCASDGYLTPGCLVKAYQHQSRKAGVQFATSVAVEEIVCGNGRVKAVKTNCGAVECACVINAAGAHAYHVARLVGLDLPIVPVRHEYFVTVPLEGLTPDLPCFRIPEMTLYGRVRDHGLLLGGWETSSLHADPRTYALSGTPPQINPDWQVLNSFADRMGQLFPGLNGAEAKCVAKGWPTFTPDGRFIIGESCRVKGFVMAGGCNAHGISGSAGIGRLLVAALTPALSHRMGEGENRVPPAYLKSLSPDRFTENHWVWDAACQQAQAVYETYYGV